MAAISGMVGWIGVDGWVLIKCPVVKLSGLRLSGVKLCQIVPIVKFQFLSMVSNCSFLSDPSVPGVRSLGPDVRPSVTERPFSDLTDVTLTDEYTNSRRGEGRVNPRGQPDRFFHSFFYALPYDAMKNEGRRTPRS